MLLCQYELIDKIKSYACDIDAVKLAEAYAFSMKAHKSQLRASGEPYFSHPLAVANILADMRLDCDSIITALLHDTVEDTYTTLEEIEKVFGDKVASLVNGVTKLKKLELQSDETKQAENFRKLVLAMSDDIRVLLVKLADRLHNMRTLHFVKSEEKRKRTARETLEIYAPLADRIGMQNLKNELEGLAFKVIYPEARESILKRLFFLKKKGVNLIGEIVTTLQDLLNKEKVNYFLTGREKTPYSIWLKMKRKNVGFDQLSDIMAFRIVVNDVENCYKTLGVIHQSYPVIPYRFKDYISTPKQNGYRSLHTSIIGPKGQRIEIQIRTEEMHAIAELGVAAHWQYKQGIENHDGRNFRWLRGLLDILESASGPAEFLENTKLEMYQDQVFCFSPKGELIALPRGATPVDMAYAIHSQIGHTCIGAKINGRMMPLRTILNNGDQVEIITDKNQIPSPTWEQFVVTGKARACIRKFINSQKRAQHLQLGKTLLKKAFAQEGEKFSEKALKKITADFKAQTVSDIYVALGRGEINSQSVVQRTQNKALKNRLKAVLQKRSKKPRAPSIPIRGLIPGMAIHYAACCHPLPGDRISGILTAGKGITIHTADCESLNQYADKPDQWVDVIWDTAQNEHVPFIGRMSMVAMHEPGVLANISSIILKNAANIVNLKITHRTRQFYDMSIDVEVNDASHLDILIAALRTSSYIRSIERATIKETPR